MFGFEARVNGQWSSNAAGEQGPSNYLATREEAEAQLQALAETLGCSVDEVRVVERPGVAAAQARILGTYAETFRRLAGDT